MMFKRAQREALGPPDWILLFTTLAIIALGLMMVYSSTSDMAYRDYDGDAAYFFKRQVTWLLVGSVAMIVAIRLPYRFWTKISIPIMAVTLVMLVALALLKQGRLLVGQSVSPVELAKLAVVIYIGHWLSSKSQVLTKLPYGLLPFTIMIGVIVGLVMVQDPPDLSEAMVIVIVAVVMFFMAGADLMQFAIGMLGGGAAFAFVVSQVEHAIPRLETYWEQMQDPLTKGGDQLKQGLIALGSGGILGMGAGGGRAKYQWLSAAHTDSIFAVIGEELGLLGSLVLVGLFVLLAYRGLRIATLAPDSFSRLMVLGVTTWITFQALVNMAVVTGAIPYTGITLPFVSVGGSSLVACMVGIGIVLSISRTVNVEGATSHEARSIGGRDGGTRVSRPDRHQSPA
jgi:cell division protein FtsW